MPEQITLLGKTFGIFCPTHPDEFHNTITFKKTSDGNVLISVNARYEADTDEWDCHMWKIPINTLTKFEKILNETGTATIEEKDSFLTIKIENGKIRYCTRLFTNENKMFISCHWLEIQEK